MPYSQWIDPRSIDWTDPLNGLANPGWSIQNNPYVFAALNDQFMQALRQGRGIQQRAYVAPEPTGQLIQPGVTFDYEVPSEPNLWLWGINASSNLAGTKDFLFNVTDSLTGAQLFSQPIPQSLMNARVNGTANRGPICFLSTPHLYTPPAYPIVRLINNSNTAQVCRVTLFCCVEYDV